MNDARCDYADGMESWGLRPLSSNETAYWQNTYVRIWVTRGRSAWRVAYAERQQETYDSGGLSRLRGLLGKAIGFVSPQEETGLELLPWEDYVPEEDGDTLGIFPVLPENSVVVRSEVPVTLGAGRSLSLFAAIPLWLSVRVVDSARHGRRSKGGYGNLGVGLVNVPVISLSQTWFGGPMTGRLCYRSDKTLSYTPDLDIDPLAYAVCPIRVRNASRVPVTIGSIAVPTEQMKLFRTIGSSDIGFWTNPLTASYSGPEELHLNVTDRPPQISEALEPWMPPRVSPTDHLFQRGIILLRDITNS